MISDIILIGPIGAGKSTLAALLAEHRGSVLDFGACQSIYEDEADFARVQQALAEYVNVVLVLPSPDPAETCDEILSRLPLPFSTEEIMP